jgi:hypothetical protein
MNRLLSTFLSLSLFIFNAMALQAQEGPIDFCIDSSLINPDMVCLTVMDPVCGCNGVTYSNSCYAEFYYGVTAWVPGPCGNPFIQGCTVPSACNYNPEAEFNDGSCVFPGQPCDDEDPSTENDSYQADCTCVGTIIALPGCTDSSAINFNSDANTDDGSCIFFNQLFDSEGNCILDLNQNGICDFLEMAGCTYPDAVNYNALATLDDGSCVFGCPGDFNGDGLITSSDLLAFLALFGTACEVHLDELSTCTVSTPEPFNNGLTCATNAPAALTLFGGEDKQGSYVMAEGILTHQADQSSLLQATLVSATDPSKGWQLNATFSTALTWSEWSTQPFPTSYRDDCGIVGEAYLDWTYALLIEGTLVGTGSLSGITLDLAHAPANNFFGVQVGLGASNVNLNYGLGAWFTYSDAVQSNVGSGSLYLDFQCD